MATRYIQALRDQQPQGPYRLAGWSMGGIVAFEMARQLHQQEQDVALLALFDSWAPGLTFKSIEAGASLANDTQMLIAFFNELTSRASYTAHLHAQILSTSLQSLEIHKQLDSILKEAHERRLLPPDVERGRLHHLFWVFRANIQAMATYAMAQTATLEPYAGRITVFQASEDTVNPDGLGWQALSTKPLGIQRVPGDHYTMLSEPHVQVLAERLKAYLDHIPDSSLGSE